MGTSAGRLGPNGLSRASGAATVTTALNRNLHNEWALRLPLGCPPANRRIQSEERYSRRRKAEWAE